MVDEKARPSTIAVGPEEPESTVVRDTLIGTAAGAAALVLTGQPMTAAAIGSAALAAAGSGWGTALWDKVKSIAIGQLDLDRKVWWQNVIDHYDPGEQGADVRESISNRMNEPAAVGVLVESLRALADRLDPAVVPAMGTLAAEYLSKRLSPDAFLRGASRMLAELSAAEHEALRGLLRELAAGPEQGLLDLEFRYASSNDVGDVPVGEDEPAYCHPTVVQLRRVGPTVYVSGDVLPTPVPLHRRLERVLTAHGLATQVDRGIRIEKRVVERLRRVIG
jgi:hypothetical protein